MIWQSYNEENKVNIIRDKNQRIEYNHVHHFNEVIKEILDYNKTGGYDEFEKISMYIKHKMTKLSFQYYIPPYVPQRCIDITSHEEKIYVIAS
jgi:hypothetical protein